VGKAKLHEVLAVEQSVKQVWENTSKETIKTFKDKPAVFVGHEKTFNPFNEGDSQTAGVVDRKALDTTVKKRLSYTLNSMVKYFDVLAQKERTNQDARADVILPDGTVLLNEMPATLLLGLESKLKQVRAILAVMPTRELGVEWEEDPDHGEDIYRTKHAIETVKDVKSIEYRVVVQPTEHHPAQVKDVPIQKAIGKYSMTKWSGMISAAEKSKYLERIDTLMRAVGKARRRANSVEVNKVNIGRKVSDYLMGK
jgi:hypothetical protein